MKRTILMFLRINKSFVLSRFFTTQASGSTEIRGEILEAALKHVNKVGWSQQALVQGINDLNLSTASLGMFPRGEIELVEHFITKCNNELPQKLYDSKVEELKTTARVRLAIKTRLEMQIPYISTWSRAMALGALPNNLPNTLKNIALLMDDIWFIAGDKSTDLNWYSKRALAASVYCSTEIFMLTDRSDSFQDTWRFLDDRLANVGTLGKTFHSITNGMPNIGSLISNLVGFAGNFKSSYSYKSEESKSNVDPSKVDTVKVDATKVEPSKVDTSSDKTSEKMTL